MWRNWPSAPQGFLPVLQCACRQVLPLMNLVHTNSFGIQNSEQFALRSVQIGDVDRIRRLFSDTIMAVCAADYSAEQLAAWASASNDRFRWIEMLSDQYSLVATFNGVLVGFASLANGHHLDLLYVHKSYLRHGIATQLYLTLEETASHLGQPVLTTHASITAKPFFEKLGFELLGEQKVSVNGIDLVHFRMQKRI
ncbi:MAG TPA: GNAT family N-acetyltransferase [Phnomibacter sp.]|nr:GNAT family N-acetyltransferase [Phnomibacter sp.]